VVALDDGSAAERTQRESDSEMSGILRIERHGIILTGSSSLYVNPRSNGA
jgi:hypothetical protein